MNGRIKFQVYSDSQKCWRTAYVLPELLQQNITHFLRAGFVVRDQIRTYRPRMAA